jgi:cell division septum initiation protein DivIVA
VRDARPDEKFGNPAFDVVARGYRMDEVDQVIEELQAQVAKLSGR